MTPRCRSGSRRKAHPPTSPLQSIPAGQATYTFNDTALWNDSTYVYAVTALDCTPLESSASTTGSVVVPPAP